MFQISITPQMENIRTSREALEEELHTTTIGEEIHRNILLVFTEVITNIIKHSNPRPLNIEVSLIPKDNDVWQFEITDCGGSFSSFIDKIGAQPKQLNVADLDEGKMGLFLLKKHFPNHRYFNDGKYNHLVMVFSGDGNDISRPLVLIIEDDIFTAKILQKTLKQTYNVSIASNAAYGLQALEKTTFDLVLCDIGLPDKSGIEIRKELALNKHLSTIPFIFLTANDDMEIQEAANDLGVDDYLKKPIEPFALYQVIDRTLQRASQVKTDISTRLDMQASTQLHPALPKKIGNLHTELFSREAETGGGDMVLHIPREDSDIIILADITGHGLDAKYFVHLYTGYLYGLIKSFGDELSPADMMGKLSNLIYEDEHLEGYYLTCMIMEIKGNEITLCNGGHIPPIYRHDYIAKPMNIMGTMPGLKRHQHYTTSHITLQKNSRLFCYTDGLNEGDGDSKIMADFSTKLLVELSQDGDVSTLSSHIEGLYQAHFGHKSQRDDMTYFILEGE